MTRTVAIIGFGSRGLGVLERIAALAGDEQIAVEVIDPVGTGAGVHDTGQPDYLLLNTTCGQISMFPDQLSVGTATAAQGPTLYDWAVARGLRLAPDGFTVGPAGRDLRPTDFLPRRVLGEYLAWFFDHLRARAGRAAGHAPHRGGRPRPRRRRRPGHRARRRHQRARRLRVPDHRLHAHHAARPTAPSSPTPTRCLNAWPRSRPARPWRSAVSASPRLTSSPA